MAIYTSAGRYPDDGLHCAKRPFPAGFTVQVVNYK